MRIRCSEISRRISSRNVFVRNQTFTTAGGSDTSKSTAKQGGKVNVNVRIPQEHKTLHFHAKEGQSMYDLVKENEEELGEYFECACGGKAECSTCHVYVDQQYFDKLPAPETNELDLLDVAFSPRDNSRLGCQIKFNKKMNGITVEVPEGVINLFGKGE
jgi:ferredoxin